MIPAPFDYLAPTSVGEALAALAEHGDEAKVLAGGQSLLPILRMRLNAPSVVIDLGRVPELQGISEDDDAVVIGAMTSYAAVLGSELVSAHAALLSKAVATGLSGSSGAPDKLRNMGSEVATPQEMTADGFAAYLKAEYTRSAAAAKLAGLTPK